MQEQKVCVVCGYIGQPKKFTKGYFLIEVFLWLCLLIPGLLYSLWRVSTRYEACPKCKSPNMIPMSSPMAQDIVERVNRAAAKASASVVKN